MLLVYKVDYLISDAEYERATSEQQHWRCGESPHRVTDGVIDDSPYFVVNVPDDSPSREEHDVESHIFRPAR